MSGTGTRGTLDGQRIIGAAIRFIDEHGLRKLTMQRLGAYLGVEGMALYRYVPGREALLDGVVEAVIEELDADPDVHRDAAGGWADYLRRLAYGLRRIALAHPEVFPLVATRPPAAPWIRPPLRSLHWIESMLAMLVAAGFSDEDAAAVYRTFSSALLGLLLLEVAGVTSQSDEDVDTESTSAELNECPVLQRLQPHLTGDTAAPDFERALDALLDRVALLLPQ